MASKFNIVSAILILAGLAGCSSPEIAENHVAVISVTRWDDYKNSLQPQFHLTADQAVAAGISDTLQLSQLNSHAFQGSLSLQLAPSSAAPAGFLTGEIGAPSTQPATPTTEPSPTTQAYPLVGSNPIGSDATLQYEAGTALYQEVQLLNRYVTDAAIRSNYRAYIVRVQVSTMPRKRGLAYDEFLDLGLFFDPVSQPVAVQSGAANLNASEPLLYTTQPKPTSTYVSTNAEIALSKLEQEYDRTYKPNALSSDGDDGVNAEIAGLQKILIESTVLNTPEAEIFREHVQRSLDKCTSPVGVPFPERGRHYTPIILPLLATDEIESALAARQADDLEQIAFSLSAAYAGLGGTANLSNLDSAMRSAVGRDYNSLLSVARINDNTVRIRIGARQTSAMSSNTRDASRESENYELITQTHYITFLIMVPKSYVRSAPQMAYFGTHASFVDIATGDKVDSIQPGRDDVEAILLKEHKNTYDDLYLDADRNSLHGTAPPNWRDTLYMAASDAENSRYDDFCKDLSHSAPPGTRYISPESANRLWLEMTEDRIQSTYDSGNFEVPTYPDPQPMLASQTVILRDDGKQTTGQILGNLTAAQPRSLRVKWEGLMVEPSPPRPTPGMPPKTAATNPSPIPINPLLASFSLGDGGLSITLPTLKGSSVKGDGSKITIELNGVQVFCGKVVFIPAILASEPAKGSVGTFAIATDEIAQSAPSLGQAKILLNYSDDFKKFIANVADPNDISNYPLLTVVGQATIVDTSTNPAPAPLVADKKVLNAYRIKLTTSGSFDVPLSQLVANQRITFSIDGPDNWGSCPKIDKNTATFQNGHQ